MHHDVCAKFQRSLQIRRHEGVIDNRQNAVLLRNRGNACQICHRQERVRRAFNKESLHIGRHLGIERFQIRCIFNGVVDSEILEDFVEYAESSAVHVA